VQQSEKLLTKQLRQNYLRESVTAAQFCINLSYSTTHFLHFTTNMQSKRWRHYESAYWEFWWWTL